MIIILLHQSGTTAINDHWIYSTAYGKVLIFSCPAWIFHFFPRNKASKLAWILRETGVMHEVCCIYLKIEWKFCVCNYRYLREKLRRSRVNPACVLHESCMCLAWKVVFSTHLPASRMQRKIRTFAQAVLYQELKLMRFTQKALY